MFRRVFQQFWKTFLERQTIPSLYSSYITFPSLTWYTSYESRSVSILCSLRTWLRDVTLNFEGIFYELNRFPLFYKWIFYTWPVLLIHLIIKLHSTNIWMVLIFSCIAVGSNSLKANNHVKLLEPTVAFILI